MIWQTRTLGGICDDGRGIIRTGPFGSQLHRKDYQDTGIPVVMPQDIVDDRISTAKIARVGEEDALRLAQHRLAPGDIVYGRRGDIGRHALITPSETGWLCGTGCLRVSLRDAEVDPAFLHYYLSNPAVIEWIYGHAVGATMPNLNTSILRSIPITYPTRALQRCISGILSSYDDLIENNTRRIAILEEMAQAIYREWFVNFRFPGHEQVEMVESELGPIPAGWSVRRLGELAEEVRRSVDPVQLAPATPYFGLEHLPRRSIALADWGCAGDVQSTKLSFRRGEILFGKIRPYFHKVGVAPTDGICSSDAIVIRPLAEGCRGLVLACVSSEAFVAHATQTSQGTKMPRANWRVLLEYPIALPPAELLHRFGKFTDDTVGKIRNLIFRNRNLRETRDLLLPPLISGELDVRSVPRAGMRGSAQRKPLST